MMPESTQVTEIPQEEEKGSIRRLSVLRRRISELDSILTHRLRIEDALPPSNREGKSGLMRSLAILFAHSGDSWFWLLGLGLIWWWGSDFWKMRAGAMVIAILATAVLVLGIKFTVRRQRPEGEWGEIYRKTDPHSFPSGHAARATMLVVMSLGLGPLWFGSLLFAWAPLVILARVAMGVHYLSDVAAGALLGVLIGLVMLEIIPRLPIPV